MMKKNSEFISRLRGMIAELGSNAELARASGVSDSRIPEWMAGSRLPSPETLIKLGRIALERGMADPFFFWALAGMDTRTLRLMAEGVLETRYKIGGEAIAVPRFRETKQGREEAGPPVPLPAEFIPNPPSTICLVLDEKSDAVIEHPRGLLIVDTSSQSAEDVQSLWNRVVVLRYAPEEFVASAFERGLYVGRLVLSTTARSFPNAESVSLTGFLQWIDSEPLAQFPDPRILFLGTYTDPVGRRGLPPGDKEAWSRRFDEIESRARSGFRFLKGVSIYGEVIGRLTGGLKR